MSQCTDNGIIKITHILGLYNTIYHNDSYLQSFGKRQLKYF